jgi:site-specific DNA-methyltransferase (adenine-specific)
MNFMREFPDKYFDLAIVDPPYGIGEANGKNAKRVSKGQKAPPVAYTAKSWDSAPPHEAYFNLLRQKAKNQIIFGGNYFAPNLPGSMGWIFWDKERAASDFSDGELAFTSFNRGVKIFKYCWDGFRQGPSRQSIERRLHPTQKPIALYSWLLENYAKPGDKILDTHLGSGSSRIAAYKKGFDFWGCEIDADYFAASEKRFTEAVSMPLFDLPGIDPQQLEIF